MVVMLPSNFTLIMDIAGCLGNTLKERSFIGGIRGRSLGSVRLIVKFV